MEKDIRVEARKQYLKYFRIWFIVTGVLAVITGAFWISNLLEEKVVRRNDQAPVERVYDLADVLTSAEEEKLRVYIASAEEQIKAAFDQSEKEVTDLHSRISQGIREAKKSGVHVGLTKGTTLTTKKSLDCIATIRKHSKDFGGTLEDPDVMKLCGCSRNSYYKYKKEAKSS